MDYFISTQLQRLKSPRKDERIMGCEHLAVAVNPPPLAINALEEATLLDPEPEVRAVANRALRGQTTALASRMDYRDIAVQLEGLQIGKKEKRIEACKKLGATPDLPQGVVTALENAVADPEPEVAQAAVSTLSAYKLKVAERARHEQLRLEADLASVSPTATPSPMDDRSTVPMSNQMVESVWPPKPEDIETQVEGSMTAKLHAIIIQIGVLISYTILPFILCRPNPSFSTALIFLAAYGLSAAAIWYLLPVHCGVFGCGGSVSRKIMRESFLIVKLFYKCNDCAGVYSTAILWPDISFEVSR